MNENGVERMRKQEQNEKGFYKCDCCGSFTVTAPYGYGAECPECGWVNDSYDARFPDRFDGYNYVSLNQAKKIWEENHMNLDEYFDLNPDVIEPHMQILDAL